MLNWDKKESPILSLLGMGGGVGSGLIQGGVTGPSVNASGGNINGQPGGNGYTYHVFTSPGNFVISSASETEFEILVVAGGGGGGSRNNNGSDGGGGGGAGGVGSPGPNSLKGGDGGAVPWCPGPIFPGMPTTWQTTVGPTGLFAGGGGGNNEPGSGYDISGGPGGGGTGTGSYQPGSNGLNNTGGGGGGTMSSGKTGGSGFVVIRYPE